MVVHECLMRCVIDIFVIISVVNCTNIERTEEYGPNNCNLLICVYRLWVGRGSQCSKVIPVYGWFPRYKNAFAVALLQSVLKFYSDQKCCILLHSPKHWCLHVRNRWSTLKELLKVWCDKSITDHVRSTVEGNVFTPVCDFVHGGIHQARLAGDRPHPPFP